MASGIVNIILRGQGGSQVAGEIGKAGKASGDLTQNIKKLGGACGQVGGAFGELISSIAKGGAFGIAAAGVALLQKVLDDFFAKQEQKEESAAQAAERAYAARMKALTDYVAATERAYSARMKMISQESKLVNDEIAAMQKLTKASLEAERAMARARGDTAGVAAIDKQLAANDYAADRKRLERTIAAASQQIAAGESEWLNAKSALSEARSILRQEESKNYGHMENGEYKAVVLSNKQRDRLEKSIAAAQAEVRKQEDRVAAARASIASAKSDRTKARAELEALELSEATKAANAELDAREKADKEAAEERQKADKKAAEERQKAEVAAAQAAAKERERLDREAHQKRMTDLRAEMAEQQKQAAAASAKMTQIQSEFDKAFAMYRDPAQAAAVIGEEQDYRNDLDQLHKDARRYGGRWRIDRLSALMAAGDTQGVSDALADWRKNKGFTPEVEAMVRASAAENAKTTVEDELRKIEKNTADLAAKLEDLLSMKGGT